LARSLAIPGELFGNFPPSKLFEARVLPNKEPNFAKDFAKLQVGEPGGLAPLLRRGRPDSTQRNAIICLMGADNMSLQ
jgi:hypothetical protein